MKFIEKHHRKICILLCVSILTCCTYQSFKQPEEVKAAIVIDDALWIALALMAACGVGYVGLNWYGNTAENLEDPFGEEAQDALSDFTDTWDEVIGKVNPYGFQFDPFNGDPEEDPPSWELLIQWIKNHPGTSIALTGTAIGAVLLEAANRLQEEQEKGEYVSEDVPDWIYNKLTTRISSGYGSKYMIMHQKATNYYYLYVFSADCNPILYINNKNAYAYYDTTYYYLDYGTSDDKNENYRDTKRPDEVCQYVWDFDYVCGNVPLYPSKNDVVTGDGVTDRIYPGTINPANTTDYTGLEMDAEGNITELPTGSFNLPSVATWNQYLSELAEAQNAADVGLAQQNAVDKLVDAVGTVPETDIDPGTGTTPDTGEGTDPDTGEDTDEEITDEQKGQFLLPEWITEKFPFCIPFDIIDAFRVLEDTERKAPAFTVPITAERYDFYYELEVDLAMFDEVAELMRTMELILFIIGLGFSTKTLMKG